MEKTIEYTIDKLPWGPYHKKLLWNCLGGWLNGYMWFAGSFLMIAQMEEVPQIDKTVLGSVLNLGGVIGCFLFPYLSDVLGKVYVFKRIMLPLLMGGALLLVTFNFWMTAGALFLIGAGAGGETTTPMNVMHDFTPSRYKARISTLSVGASLGPIISHITGLVLVELWTFDFPRWRVLCIINLVLTLGVACLRSRLLESPVYLFNKGDDEYIQVLSALGCRESLEEPLILHVDAVRPNGSIFSKKYRGLTVRLLLCSLLSSYAASACIAFLTLYYEYNEPRDMFILFIFMQVSGVTGASQSAVVVNSRLGRRWTYVSCYAVAGALMIPLAWSNSLWVLLVSGSLFNGVLQLGGSAKNLVNSESYDSSVRGQGIGFLSALSRCASIASPISIGAIQALYGNALTLYYIISLFVLTSGLALSLRETKRTSKSIK